MSNSLNINIEVTDHGEDQEYFQQSIILYKGFTIEIWCDVDEGLINYEVIDRVDEQHTWHFSLYKAISYIDNLIQGGT